MASESKGDSIQTLVEKHLAKAKEEELKEVKLE